MDLPPTVGAPLGRYRLLLELGQGGMADVFLGVNDGPGRFQKLTVIKRIRRGLAGDPEFIRMFLDEARLASRLNHPNIVQTFEAGEAEGRFYLAMEFLDGQPLDALHRAVLPDGLPAGVAMRIVCDVLAGLDHAHRARDIDGSPLAIVHRDVSPPNIFVTYEGIAKIVDFGIAKARGATHETSTGVVKGKVRYMPPEQAGAKEVDASADVYAAGVVLWELLSKRRMWEGRPDVDILGALSRGEVRTLRELDLDLPPSLVAAVDRALEPDRARRTPSAAAMLEELETSGVPLAAPREVGEIVGRTFAMQRAETRAAIEEQLSVLGDRRRSPPSLRPLRVSLTGQGDDVPISRDAPTLRPRGPAGVTEERVTIRPGMDIRRSDPPTTLREGRLHSEPPTTVREATASGTTAADIEIALPRSRVGPLAVGVVGTVLALGAAAAYFATRSEPATGATPPPPTSSTAPVLRPPPPPDRTHPPASTSAQASPPPSAGGSASTGRRLPPAPGTDTLPRSPPTTPPATTAPPPTTTAPPTVTTTAPPATTTAKPPATNPLFLP